MKMLWMLLFAPLCLNAQIPMGGITFSGSGTPVTVALRHVNGSDSGGVGKGGSSVAITGVSAGDLIVCNVNWTGTATMSGFGDGTSGFTMLTAASIVDGGGGTDHVQMAYLLSSVASGTVTYSAAFTANVTYIELFCWDAYVATGSASWHYDASNQAASTGTAVDTGAITTTGTAEFVPMGGKLFYTAATISNPLINAVTPTDDTAGGSATGNYYHRVVTSPFTSGHGNATYSVSTTWAFAISAFSAY